MFKIQKENKNAVLLVIDSANVAKGVKAYRLTKKFMKLYASKSFTQADCVSENINANDIFEGVNVVVKDFALAKAYFFELQATQYSEGTAVTSVTSVAKTLALLCDGIDDFAKEQAGYTNYLRNTSRQLQQQQQFLSKRV